MRLLLASAPPGEPMDTSHGNPTDTPPGDPMDFLQGLKSTQGSNPAKTPQDEPMNFLQSLLKSKKLKLKDFLHFFLQDVADADNFASIAAYIKCVGHPTKARPLHFVLVQRADNFRWPKFHPGCGFKFPGPVSSGREEPCPEDSLLTALHGAARLREFLKLLKVPLDYVFIYDGGLTDEHSNLSNLVHASDYLLRNLISGDTTSPEDYISLQSKLNGEVFINEAKTYDFSMEPIELKAARQKRTREHIQTQLDSYAVEKATLLRPLSDLLEWLAEEDPRSFIVAFALAPLTGLANLFAMDKRGILRDRLVGVFGQLFAWDNCAPHFWTRSPEGVNILKNQFNVDCDTKAVKSVLEQLEQCINLILLVLVPTEAIKDPLLESFLNGLHRELKAIPFKELRPIEQLWFQWNSIKGGKAQVIFDPMVIYLWHCLSQIDIDQKDLTANELFDMKPASVSIPGKQKVFGWNRDVFRLKLTESDSPEPTESGSPEPTESYSSTLKISAALKLTDKGIETVQGLLVKLLKSSEL